MQKDSELWRGIYHFCSPCSAKNDPYNIDTCTAAILPVITDEVKSSPVNSTKKGQQQKQLTSQKSGPKTILEKLLRV
jgi:hypothetical protein